MTLVSDREQRTLVRLLRVAYPHDHFPAGPYERTADAIRDAAARDPRLLAQLVQGLGELDVLRDVPFTELADDAALAVLRGVRDTPFFRSVIAIAVVKLYDDHEVWDLLGYEGPSFDRGGYLERGFNDLDWLPEPKIEEASA